MKITPPRQHIKVHQMVCSAPASGQSKHLLFLFFLLPPFSFSFFFFFFSLRQFVADVTKAFCVQCFLASPQLPPSAPHAPLPSHPARRQP